MPHRRDIIRSLRQSHAESRRARFTRVAPHGYFLEAKDHESLTRYLQSQGWIDSTDTVVGLSPAGDGNMNCTLRVKTYERTFILKQSRPWVEKYPEIAAPFDRAIQEGAFYEIVESQPSLARMMPQLLAVSHESRMLMLTDLGKASDFTGLYNGDILTGDAVGALGQYLSTLHTVELGSDRRQGFVNRDMRHLNHRHIFDLPLAQTGLGVNLDHFTKGLEIEAVQRRSDFEFCQAVKRLGEVYLQDGKALLHGDFYPGSWVKTDKELYVIDPEFCFMGPPEFDVGVLLAHLRLSDQPQWVRMRAAEAYMADSSFNKDLAAQFAGVEVMRRLLGVTQLPLQATLTQKRAWLDESRNLVCGRNSWGMIVCGD